MHKKSNLSKYVCKPQIYSYSSVITFDFSMWVYMLQVYSFPSSINLLIMFVIVPHHRIIRILNSINQFSFYLVFVTENLGVTCEREELPQYAGLSYQAAAKCQNSLGNFSEEGFLLHKSSRQFLACHNKLINHKMVSTDEHLNHSITCYHECLER